MSYSSSAAIALLQQEEGFVGHPYWPGTALSGVTLDWGWDAGQHTSAQFQSVWGNLLPTDDSAMIAAACGVKGRQAGDLVDAGLGQILIPRAACQAAFDGSILPSYEALLRQVMPGVEQLPPDAFGALMDLVFNRGGTMADDPSDPQHGRRLEMRSIRSAAAAYEATTLPGQQQACLRAIANQLTDMGNRLWPEANDSQPANRTLRLRRLAEAALVLQAAGGPAD